MNKKNVTILYEDDDVVVLDKQSGITVNKSDTTRYQDTVQDWAEKYLSITPRSDLSIDDPERDFFNRAGIVHRLDKETSGILLIAKNPQVFLHLQSQFKERTVKKKYTALAHGRLKPEVGEIVLPVGRLPWNRKQFGVIAGGRPSETAYETIAVYKKGGESFTLVRLFPKTGRTHQIRVHLKYLNYPIVSDFLYAGRKTARRDRLDLPRVFLHASEITFLHPTSQQSLTIESKLPEELEDYLQTLQKVA